MPIKLNKKQTSIIVTIIFIVCFYFLNNGQLPTSETLNTVTSNIDLISTSSEIIKNVSTVDQTEPAVAGQTITNYSDTEYYTVTRIVDGDTFEVNLNGTLEKLRLIGINTPETVDPRRKVECFGKEASAQAKKLLTNQKVKLASDTSQTVRDDYGRLLVYVWLPDGTFFNLKMIADGYAYEYTYKTPYFYQTEFRQAQAEAKTNKQGLWSPNSCNGKK